MISNENFEEYLKALGEFYIDNCDHIKKFKLKVVRNCCQKKLNVTIHVTIR